MPKLIGKLIGFVIFACVFACAAASIIAVSTGLVDLREMFPGLPEPPQIDTSNLPLPEGAEIPRMELPPQLQPGEALLTRDLVPRRPLLARVPAPQQLARAPQVIGTNIFLAILMALIFGATSTILNNMLQDEEMRIEAWLRAFGIYKLVGWIGRVFRWTLGGAIKQGCLTLPLVALIFVLYGVIYAFLEEGTSIFSRESTLLVLNLAVTIGVVAFAADFARRLMGFLWRSRSRFHLYPANLLIAVLTVLVSRIFVLTPGIIVGTPGGADVDIPERKREQREVVLSLVTLGMQALVGGIAWAISGYVLTFLDAPFDARLIGVAATVLTIVQNLSLAVFLVALETLFFEMLPLAYGAGQVILRWSWVVWGILFTPIAFLFNHALLNPQSGFLDSFLESNVRFAWLMILALVGITAALWFYFNVLDDILRDWLGVRLPGEPGSPQQSY